MSIGVLALQGASDPHLATLRSLGLSPIAVRRAEEVAALTHLVIPGGESTTIRHLLDLFDLSATIERRASQGELAIFGTCAGAILLGNNDGTKPRRFGLLDVEFERNAFGSQVDSFTSEIALAHDPRPFRGIFIRAPRIRSVGADVRILATWNDEPVLVAKGAFMAATFHPELANDARIHEIFLASRPMTVATRVTKDASKFL